MSRSVKDLRNIVTASRQSMRDEDSNECVSGESDEIISDSDNEGKDLQSYIDQRPSSALGQSNFKSVSVRPESARSATNKPSLNNNIYDVNKNYSDRPHTAHNDRHDRISKLNTFPNRYIPVPPIGKRPHTTKATDRHPAVMLSACLDHQISTCYSPDLRQMINDDKMQDLDLNDDLEDRNFDVLFQFLDGTIIATWLEICNRTLKDLNYFMELHLVDFIQFFLTDLPFIKYTQLLDLEFSILLDHFKCAFRSGFTLGHLDDIDLQHLAKSVVKEYTGKLKNVKSGPSHMLNIITAFCNDRKETHHKLLKDIVCHSSDKKNIQWLLAIRAFSLLSFVSGILKFYENFSGKIVFPKVHVRFKLEKKQYNANEFVIQAVKRDYLQVLDYFYTNHRIDFKTILDEKKRNLVCIATSGKNYEALIYLLAVSSFVLLKYFFFVLLLLHYVIHLKLRFNVWNDLDKIAMNSSWGKEWTC